MNPSRSGSSRKERRDVASAPSARVRARPVPARQPAAVWAGAAVLILLTFISYLPAIGGGYIWDDDSYIIDNVPHFQDADGLARLWQPRTTKQYYPAVFTTFWVEYQVWGLNPMGYHIVNVLLHVANALLVWRLCVMLGVPGGHAAGWLIAMIFALHPVHVESVAWITERKNVLSGFFYLLAGVAYLKFDGSQNRNSARDWVWYAASLVLFVLALLSKTVTCSLPAALILILLYQRKPLTALRLAPLIPMFIVGLLLALHTAELERTNVGAEGEEFAFSFIERMLIASKALLFYPYSLVWPWPLMFIYPRWTIDASDWSTYWSLALVVLIGLGALAAYLRGWRGPALALAFYAGTIFPALGFFNVYPMIFSFVADHFQYLASLGIIVLIVGGAAYLAPLPRHVLAGALALPVLASLTATQAQTYESAETVFRDSLAKNPDAWMPHNNLSALLTRQAGEALQQGETDRVVALADEALFHAGEALRIRPHHRPALNNMSEALQFKGRALNDSSLAERALSYAQRALELLAARQSAEIERHQIVDPRSPIRCEAHLQVARLQERLGRFEEALASYQDGLKWDPQSLDAHRQIARLYERLDRYDEAAAHFELILQRQPKDVEALRVVGEAAERSRRYEQAEACYRRGLDAVVNDQDFLHLGYRLARVLTLHEGDDPARANEAVRLAEELNQRAGPPSPFILGLLSSAYANANRTDDARRTGVQAIELAEKVGLPDLAAEIRRKLNQLPADSGPG